MTQFQIKRPVVRVGPGGGLGVTAAIGVAVALCWFFWPTASVEPVSEREVAPAAAEQPVPERAAARAVEAGDAAEAATSSAAGSPAVVSPGAAPNPGSSEKATSTRSAAPEPPAAVAGVAALSAGASPPERTSVAQDATRPASRTRFSDAASTPRPAGAGSEAPLADAEPVDADISVEPWQPAVPDTRPTPRTRAAAAPPDTVVSETQALLEALRPVFESSSTNPTPIRSTP